MRSSILDFLCILVLALLPLATLAATLTGRVVGVQDGDTLTVLVDRQPVKVRLAEIDAPEMRQPFGNRSKQSLSQLCYNKQADIDERGKDRYGRTIARVNCDGINAEAEQVKRGMAWVFDRYAEKDSPLYALQASAKQGKAGLWRDEAPIPPWEWRSANAKSTRKQQ